MKIKITNYSALYVSIFLTIIIYLYGLNGVFVYDDLNQITGREKLHNIFNFHDVIFCGLRQNRVLQNIALALNWTIAPGVTWGFKFFNLTLHFFNAVMLYHVLKKIFKDKPNVTIFSTALFLIHPLQIQSVTYVMGLISQLQAFFYLLSLYWYSKFGLSRFFGLSVILITSLLAKETCALIPLVLISYEVLINQTPIKKLEIKKWLIIFAIPLLYFPFYAVVKDPTSMYQNTTGFKLYPFWKYLAGQLYFQSLYLVTLFKSSLQSIIYPLPEFDQRLEIVGAIFGGLLWLSSGIFIVARYKKYPRVTLFLILYFITYFPTNSFFQMINPFAEYRLYQSNIVLFVLISLALDQFLKTTKIKYSMMIGIVLFFSYFTFHHVRIWKMGDIYEQGWNRFPKDMVLNLEYGGVLLKKGEVDRAYFHFSEAYHSAKEMGNALMLNYSLTAQAYAKAGNFKKAWEVLEAVEAAPKKTPPPKEYFLFKKSMVKKIKKGLNSQHESK